MATLDNKIAIVTGSSSGIGKTVAIAFAQEGANLVLNYPNESQLQNVTAVKDTIATLGRQVIAVQADVSQEDQVQTLIDTAGFSARTVSKAADAGSYCFCALYPCPNRS